MVEKSPKGSIKEKTIVAMVNYFKVSLIIAGDGGLLL